MRPTEMQIDPEKMQVLMSCLDAMLPDRVTACSPEMTLGALIEDKGLYPDLIVEAFDAAFPGANPEPDHFLPERRVSEVAYLLEHRLAPPPPIDF